MYIDAHSHYSDARLSDQDVQNLILQAELQNIGGFMLAGVSPADWERQKLLKKLYPDKFYSSFGLHPYFVSASSAEDCELALDQLVQWQSESYAIGEMGLDFREKILQSEKRDMDEQKAHQIEFFENQIQISRLYKKPMVLHVVQAHEKAIEILELWGYPSQMGMVHAYSGSYEVAKKYIDNGFLISIGSAITYEKNKKIKETVSKMPLESLLLESDMPDQPPQGWLGYNNSTSLWQIAKSVAEIRQKTAEEILHLATDNFKKLFSV